MTREAVAEREKLPNDHCELCERKIWLRDGKHYANQFGESFVGPCTSVESRIKDLLAFYGGNDGVSDCWAQVKPLLARALAACALRARKEALKQAADAYMAHYHVAGKPDIDRCFACGHDLRHGIHLRGDETKESRLVALERAAGEKS